MARKFVAILNVSALSLMLQWDRAFDGAEIRVHNGPRLHL